MSCNCNKAINTSTCLEQFTIGISDEVDTGFNVYFKTPTGRVDVYPVVSDGSGNIIVESPAVRIGDTYEIWINKAGDAIEKRRAFTALQDGEQTDVECINIEFTPCYNQGDDGNLLTGNQIIELK